MDKQQPLIVYSQSPLRTAVMYINRTILNYLGTPEFVSLAPDRMSNTLLVLSGADNGFKVHKRETLTSTPYIVVSTKTGYPLGIYEVSYSLREEKPYVYLSYIDQIYSKV